MFILSGKSILQGQQDPYFSKCFYCYTYTEINKIEFKFLPDAYFHLLIYRFQQINMQKIIITLLLVGIMFAMQVSCQESMLAPPNRPSEFRSPEELRKYLKALNEYYAIVGRPR